MSVDENKREHEETPVERKLNHPWLVAVWPGMGSVALSAGYYMMSKLGMHLLSEYSPGELFDVDHVEVKEGIIRTGHEPRCRFFVWSDQAQERDLVVFIGEAQPPMGKRLFCTKLLEYAERLGVERVFTFAAMATQSRPDQEPRVFGAATNAERLAELKRLELDILEDGKIGGLNGVLLGVAAERGLPGVCLLGEIPQIFMELPFPKASLAVLKVFTTMARIDLDFAGLSEQAQAVEAKLGELWSTVESRIAEQRAPVDEALIPEPEEESRVNPEEVRRIEELFSQAAEDRSKAYELKSELDRLGIFKDYEDRFLDLFKKAD